MRTYTPNLNPYRTPEEVAELHVIANDTSNPQAAKRAKIVLQMNEAHKDDGSHMSFDDRIKSTMSAEEVSKGRIIDSLRLFNAAGINGIKRINAEVKPDIQDRKEDSVPVPVQESEQVFKTINQIEGFEEKALQKASELAGLDLATMTKAKEVLEQLGIQLIPTNPTLFQHVEEKNQKHAEIGGFYIGYRFGVFAIASKNLLDVEENKPFILRKVFNGTDQCQESADAAWKIFEETNWGPVSDVSGNEHQKLDVFFTNLQKVYPYSQGWSLHCYVYDAQALTDPINGEPIINGLPDLEGCTYEKTVHLCDFTSPIKAAFQLAYFRDKTNIQGWKIRDRVTNLLQKSTLFTTPVLYVGAKAEIVDTTVATIEMTAKITFPNGNVVLVNTRRQEIPSADVLGSDSMEEFKEGTSKLDYIVTDVARELSGNTIQSIINTAQAQCAGNGGHLSPILIEAESGRRTIWVQGSITQYYGPKDMIYTDNFMDMVGKEVINGSYRHTADQLNRSLHRKDYEKVHFTTLQDKIDSDGKKIQVCLGEECQEGLDMYEVKIENGKLVSHKIPQSAIKPLDKAGAIPVYDWGRIKRKLDRRNQGRSEADQLTLEQVKEVLSTMELDPRNTVYVMFDGVLLKKQKEERKSEGKTETGKTQLGKEDKATENATTEPPKKKRGRPRKAEAAQKKEEEAFSEQEKRKKRFETHNVYILYQNKAYVIMGATMEEACRYALGFLLKKGLLEGKELVFFSDGAKKIKDTIKEYFGFRKYHLFLDHFHVEQKIYQYFTQFLKGGKARLTENAMIREQFFKLLWEGKFEECKEFINNISSEMVKCPETGQNIIDYLINKAEYLYHFEIRKLAGLINSSNRVEQTNNELESRRQKKNGMAWTPSGSRSLAAFSMIYKNRIQAIWFQKGEISFEMFETKVNPAHMPIAA